MSFEVKTVFLVEDSTPQTKHYCAMLESIGYDSRSFATPQTLLDSLDRLPLPSVLLSDVYLPGMTGIELLKQLLNHETWCTVPCILMSGSAQRADIEAARALRIPPEGFLIKPVDATTLDETLQGITRSKKPITLLREVQRSRLALELHTRRIERTFASRLADLNRESEEASKLVSRLDSEFAAIRMAQNSLPQSERQEVAAELEQLDALLIKARDKVRFIARTRSDVCAKIRLHATEAAHEGKLLEARLRTAQDVMNNSD